MTNPFLDSNGLLYLWQKIVNKFVAKEAGKGLSTNDYTTDEKNKLAGVETGATATTVVDSVSSTSSTSALSANQGKILSDRISSINTNLENLGAGDMLKSVYDTDGDGVIDKAANATKLNGYDASYYASAATTLLGYGITDAYTRNETDTAISAAVANAGHLKREIVENLPATGDAHIIYMVKAADDSENNKYIEYMYINNAWEKTGDTDIDLSEYLKISDISVITNAEIDTIVAS